MADGRLLKPTHPAMSVDSTSLQRVFGSGGATGQLWIAFSEKTLLHPPYTHRWDQSPGTIHVFATELVEDYDLSAKEFPPFHTTFPKTTFPQSVAFQYTLDGTVTRRANFGTDTALIMRVSMCGEADFQHWIIAPVLNNGLVLFGELTKIVPVSETCFKSFINVGDIYIISLEGAPGENVTLIVFDSSSQNNDLVECTIGPSGSAVLHMASTGSSCTG